MRVIIALVLLVCFAYGLSIRRPVLGLSCGSLPPKYQAVCLLAKKSIGKKSAQTESDFLGALSIGMKAFKAFKAIKAMKKQKKQKKQQQQEQPESDAQFFKRVMSWWNTKGKGMFEKGKNLFNKGKELYGKGKEIAAILKSFKKPKKQPQQEQPQEQPAEQTAAPVEQPAEQPAEPESDAEFFGKLKKWWDTKGKGMFEKGKNLFNKGKELYGKGKEIAAILKSFKKPKKQPQEEQPAAPAEQPAEEPVNNDEPQDDVESDGPKSDAIARAIVSRVAGSTTPKGRCAQYSREAIEAATGLRLERKTSAKDYGSSLLKVGFRAVSGPARAGDVAIFQAIAKHPHGHMQINGGSAWYSDFKQRDVYAGPGYRNIRAPYQLYRLD